MYSKLLAKTVQIGASINRCIRATLWGVSSSICGGCLEWGYEMTPLWMWHARTHHPSLCFQQRHKHTSCALNPPPPSSSSLAFGTIAWRDDDIVSRERNDVATARVLDFPPSKKKTHSDLAYSLNALAAVVLINTRRRLARARMWVEFYCRPFCEYIFSGFRVYTWTALRHAAAYCLLLVVWQRCGRGKGAAPNGWQTSTPGSSQVD